MHLKFLITQLPPNLNPPEIALMEWTNPRDLIVDFPPPLVTIPRDMTATVPELLGAADQFSDRPTEDRGHMVVFPRAIGQLGSWLPCRVRVVSRGLWGEDHREVGLHDEHRRLGLLAGMTRADVNEILERARCGRDFDALFEYVTLASSAPHDRVLQMTNPEALLVIAPSSGLEECQSRRTTGSWPSSWSFWWWAQPLRSERGSKQEGRVVFSKSSWLQPDLG
jgi:hypothetical protein